MLLSRYTGQESVGSECRFSSFFWLLWGIWGYKPCSKNQWCHSYSPSQGIQTHDLLDMGTDPRPAELHTASRTQPLFPCLLAHVTGNLKATVRGCWQHVWGKGDYGKLISPGDSSTVGSFSSASKQKQPLFTGSTNGNGSFVVSFITKMLTGSVRGEYRNMQLLAKICSQVVVGMCW